MYCYKCGKEVNDGAIYCSNCGTNISLDIISKSSKSDSSSSSKQTLRLIAFILALLSLIITAIVGVILIIISIVYKLSGDSIDPTIYNNQEYSSLVGIYHNFFVIFLLIGCLTLITISWQIYFVYIIKKAYKNLNMELSIPFKICVLIFSNMISGICLLCDD